MTTTLDTMLPEFARHTGSFIGTFTTTTNIAADNSVICTGLASRGIIRDDRPIDYFARFTSGNNDDDIRHVSDFAASTDTLTVSGPVLAAEAGETTFELYRYDPTLLVDALNDGRLEAFPELFAEVVDRSLTASRHQTRYARPTSIAPGFVRQVHTERRIDAKTHADNLAGTLDCDFEGDLTDWSVSNITLTAESESTSPNNFMVFSGRQSGKAVVAVTSVATMLLTVPSGSGYAGQEINFTIWVYSKTAARVSATVFEDSSSAATGTAHAGGGWERLTVSRTVAQGITTLQVGLSVTSGAAFTFWADEAIAISGPSEAPRYPGSPVLNWREEGDSINIWEPVDHEGQLMVWGMGFLSSVSDGTDTMEVNESQRKLLYDYAAEQLFQGDIDTLGNDNQNAALRRNTHFRNRQSDSFGRMLPMPMLRNEAV